MSISNAVGLLEARASRYIGLMRFQKLLWRALLLRCPMCGAGRLFRTFFTVNERCPKCHGDFQREEGFYLGSIYINYGLTTLIVAIAYPLLLFSGTLSNDALFWLALGFMLLFPVVIFRHARSLWLGFDQLCDPHDGEEGTS